MRICGRNTNTLPMPANTPLTSRSFSKLAGNAVCSPIAECGDAEFDGVHRHLRPGKHCLKYQKQDNRQDHRPEYRMQHDRVHAIARGYAVEPVCADQGQNSANLGLVVLDFSGAGRSPCRDRPRARRRFQAVEHRHQIPHAAGLDADGFDHRHAQLVGQTIGIDIDAFASGDVAHIEGNDHGQAQPLQAQRQTQILPQVGGVGDADDEVGLSLPGAAAQQHIRGDLLIGRQRVEAVGPGQIKDANAQSGRGEKGTFFTFNRDTA